MDGRFDKANCDEPEEVLVAKDDVGDESKNKEYELLENKYEFLRLDNLTCDSMVGEGKIEVNRAVEGNGE
uniref:Uncharacterized protein n=1 Tax=Cucumis melo TaxID=3656 RepID=A0A9I9EKM7_CUCME